MKQFEIHTPALREATDAFRSVLSGRKDGTMERDEARDIVSAGNGVVRAVGQELRVRLAMPRIAAAEAKLIEHERSGGGGGAGSGSPLSGDDNRRIETVSKQVA